MTTNTRQYLAMGSTNAQGRYELRLRTGRQAYANARVIATFPTHAQLCAAWDMVTTAEGMIDVQGSKFD